MIERGYFRRALRIVAGDPIPYVIGGLILHLLSAAALGLLVGPTICGIVWITLKHCRGQEVVFSDIFRGFDNFVDAFLAGVAFALLVSAGVCLLVVPGIILGALFCFVFPFVVDRGLSFSEAMAASSGLARDRHDLLDRSLFFLVALLVGISGTMLCLVGLLFTWPLMWAVVAVAYEDLQAPARAP